jgi:hypothetical protein
MRKLKTVCLLLFLLLGATVADAMMKGPRPEVLGIKLGMKEEAARSRLRKVAHQQKEERENEGEGEQEVWTLRKHPRFDYLIIRFTGEHRVWFVTAVPRKESRMQYSELGDLKDARQQTDGTNYTYTWQVAARGREPGYVVVARGSDPQYLTSYSIYLSAKTTVEVN